MLGLNSDVPSELKALRLARSKANEALSKVRLVAEDFVLERRQAADEQIKADMKAKYGDDLAALIDAFNAADKLVKDEEDRIARIGAGAKYPVGTVMLEWKRRNYSYRNDKQLSGERGVYEIITRNSVHPRGRYPACIGSEVIRKVRKNGKPSAQYVVGYKTWDWYPEGVDPNKAVF